MPLNDTQRAIIATEVMDLKEPYALAYMKSEGHGMSRATYYREKGKLEASINKRLFEVAQKGFVMQHMQRIDQLEHIEREYWENYITLKGRKQEYSACKILEMIANLQPLLSSYYEATKEVMETGAEEDNPIPDITREEASPPAQ